MKLKYIQDPGHGWIAAPLELIREWGVTPSRYSYRDAVTGYLEEDCDAGLFLAAAAARGVSVTLDEHHTDRDSFVRALPRFNGVSK